MTIIEPAEQRRIDIKSGDHEIRMAVDGKPFAVAWGPGVGGEWFTRLVDIEADADAESWPDRGAAMKALFERAGVAK